MHQLCWRRSLPALLSFEPCGSAFHGSSGSMGSLDRRHHYSRYDRPRCWHHKIVALDCTFAMNAGSALTVRAHRPQTPRIGSWERSLRISPALRRASSSWSAHQPRFGINAMASISTGKVAGMAWTEVGSARAEAPTGRVATGGWGTGRACPRDRPPRGGGVPRRPHRRRSARPG
jgi:hypothetical protein